VSNRTATRQKKKPVTAASVRHCPKCASPAVEFSDVSTSASCLACKWVGRTADLLLSDAGGSNALELSAQAQHEFVGLIAAAISRPVLGWLMKWGFVENDERIQQVALRYIKSGTLALYKSIISTRLELEQEKRK
jgi:ribosomal protein S27E